MLPEPEMIAEFLEYKNRRWPEKMNEWCLIDEFITWFKRKKLKMQLTVQKGSWTAVQSISNKVFKSEYYNKYLINKMFTDPEDRPLPPCMQREVDRQDVIIKRRQERKDRGRISTFSSRHYNDFLSTKYIFSEYYI